MKGKYSQFYAILKKHGLDKADVVADFTEGRTDSLSSLSDGEFKELMIRLNRYNAPPENDSANQMRRKMIAIARNMRWELPDPNPLKRGHTVADMERLNNWCIKSGKYHKPLNAHTAQELGVLVTIFEEVERTFLVGLQKRN